MYAFYVSIDEQYIYVSIDEQYIYVSANVNIFLFQTF